MKLTNIDTLEYLKGLLAHSSNEEFKKALKEKLKLDANKEKILDTALNLRNLQIDKAREIIDQIEPDKYSFTYMLLKSIIYDLENNNDEANKSLVRTIILSPKKEFRESILNAFGLKYPEIEKTYNFIENIKTHKLKILHGTMEIANQMHTYVSGLKKLGAFARSVNYYPVYLKYKNDYIIPLEKVNENIINQFINSFDIFHFHFGTSLNPAMSDLPFLKNIGKTILMHYWGSEVRRKSKALELNPYAKVKEEEEKIVKKLIFVSQYINHCVTEFTLPVYVEEYHKHTHFLAQAIDLNKYPYSPKTPGDKIIIAHAPTDPEYKGTPVIKSVIESLSDKYPIEFVLVQGKSHAEARKIYMKADLIIDQLYSEGYGLFTIESMALGKPVIVSVPDYFVNKYPPDLPVIRANPDNLQDVLEKTLSEPEKLPQIGAMGRKYVEKYHDIEKIKFDLLELYYTVMREEGKI